jgi:hypothetical protein
MRRFRARFAIRTRPIMSISDNGHYGHAIASGRAVSPDAYGEASFDRIEPMPHIARIVIDGNFPTVLSGTSL